MYKIYADGELLCDSSIQELAIISPIVKLAANSAGSFEFTLPATHPYINSIERRSTIISVYIDEDTEPTFQGIATEEDEDFYKNVTFICEGELTYLNDTIQRQVKYTSLTVRQVLEAIIAVHNSQVSSDKQFTVGQVTVNDTITCYTNYNSTLTEIKENLVDEFGGYIRIRYASGTKYIDYLADSPRTNSQIIKLGENLLDYKSNINDTEIATSILPLGYTLDTQVVEGLDAYLTITSAAADDYHPIGADYIYSSDAVSNYGFIQKVVTWNDITSATDLLAKAEAYLSDIQFENVVLSVSAIDMAYLNSDEEHFKVLDKIRVISTAHGMDRYFILSEQTLNLNNPEEDQITLGINEQLSLSAKTASTNAEILAKIEQLPTSNMVQSAIDNATALITGAEGGYVVITRNSDGQPTEIKVQDALESPTKIWRWNVNGLGYSSDGGATYGLAMTMNGAIVADYITSGTMYADRIKGGTLTLGGASNTNGQLIVKDASSNTVGQWNKDGIRLYSGTVGGWYIGSNYIQSYDGGTEANSLYRVSLYKYVNNPNNHAIQIATRASTSDAWTTQIAMTYEGKITTYQRLEVLSEQGGEHGIYTNGGLRALGQLNVEGRGIIEGNLDVGGYAWFAGGYGGSDRRSKQNIEDLTDELAIDLLTELSPKTFEMIKHPDVMRSGLIAQDVQEILEKHQIDPSYLVASHEDTKTKETRLGINYDDLIAVLIKGWQIQQKEINELKSEIEALKGVNS